jgi:hypothetical protein
MKKISPATTHLPIIIEQDEDNMYVITCPTVYSHQNRPLLSRGLIHKIITEDVGVSVNEYVKLLK